MNLNWLHTNRKLIAAPGDPACHRRLVGSFGRFLPRLGQFPVGAPNVLHVDQRRLGGPTNLVES